MSRLAADGAGAGSPSCTRAAGMELPICEAAAVLLKGRAMLDGAIASLPSRPRRDEQADMV